MPAILLYLLLVFVSGNFLACSLQETAGGSDHPNELIGGIVDTSNVPVLVNLYQIGFRSSNDSYPSQPQLIVQTQPDKNGSFSISQIEAGQYYFEIIREDSSAVNISAPFTVPEDPHSVDWPLKIGDIPLRIPGRITLTLPGSQDEIGTTHSNVWPDSLPCNNVYVILGTHYQSSFDQNSNTCVIPYVPSGMAYQVVLSSAPDTLVETVFVNAGTNPNFPSLRNTPQEIILFPDNSLDTISVIVNDTISVILSSNGSTGYSWEDYSDTDFADVLVSESFCPEDIEPGSSCDRRFTWIVPAGFSVQSTIDLRYEQSWDANSTIDQFVLILRPTE